jgi:hypothetical protein
MAKPIDDRRPQSDRVDPVPQDKRHPPDGNPGDDQIEHLPGHGARRGDQGDRKSTTRQSRPRYADLADEHGTLFV